VADPAVARDRFEDAFPPEAVLVADADQMLNELRPDVVHIVTPPETHAALAMRALRAGCHVYVEKPFTPSRAEAAAVLERGRYAWGKAESEVVVRHRGAELGSAVKIVRLGTPVEYSAFQPPGRLGHELGPWFFAIGDNRTPLSVCDVGTAAHVLRSYVQDFETAPPVLNLVDAPAPTRREPAERVKAGRPDPFWVPAMLLRILSPVLKLVRRVALHNAKPLDVYSAFASEYYRADLAAMMNAKAGETTVRSTPN
jgi:hypothetical protein